jgi:hypothetical protein
LPAESQGLAIDINIRLSEISYLDVLSLKETKAKLLNSSEAPVEDFPLGGLEPGTRYSFTVVGNYLFNSYLAREFDSAGLIESWYEILSR